MVYTCACMCMKSECSLFLGVAGFAKVSVVCCVLCVAFVCLLGFESILCFLCGDNFFS